MNGFFTSLRTRDSTSDGGSPAGQQNDIVAELILKNTLQQRTTTIVTISFNVLAALLIILSILIDANRARRRGTGLNAS
jgi:hypothetical protein